MNDANRLDVRLCGLASILAGVAWTGGTIFNLVARGSIEPSNTIGAVVALVSTTLMVFAFIGVYAGLSGRAGLFGLLGAGLGIVGATLLSGVNTLAFARSVGAIQVSRPPLAVGGTGVLALILGVVLLGVAVIRAEAYESWSGVPFVLAAALLPLRAITPELSALAIASASVGFIWLGWKVWSGPGEDQPSEGPAAAASPVA